MSEDLINLRYYFCVYLRVEIVVLLFLYFLVYFFCYFFFTTASFGDVIDASEMQAEINKTNRTERKIAVVLL